MCDYSPFMFAETYFTVHHMVFLGGVPWASERNVYSSVLDFLWMSVRSGWLIVLFRSSMSFPIFCFCLILSITEMECEHLLL